MHTPNGSSAFSIAEMIAAGRAYGEALLAAGAPNDAFNHAQSQGAEFGAAVAGVAAIELAVVLSVSEALTQTIQSGLRIRPPPHRSAYARPKPSVKKFLSGPPAAPRRMRRLGAGLHLRDDRADSFR